MHTFDIAAQLIVSLYREIATSAHKSLLAMTRYFYVSPRSNYNPSHNEKTPRNEPFRGVNYLMR